MYMVGRGVDALGFPALRDSETIELECPECRHSGPHTVLARDRASGRELIECGDPMCYHEFEIKVTM